MRPRILFIILCGVLAAGLVAGEGADSPSPALTADPSPDGLVSWWLTSPLLKTAKLDKIQPPTNFREGDAVTGAEGNWALTVSPSSFVSFRQFAPSEGVVWAAVRVNSLTGGTRRIAAASCGGVKVFVNGQCCVDKPMPMSAVVDQAEGEAELPKGESEVCVATALRPGYVTTLKLSLKQQVDGALKAPAGDTILVPAAHGKEPDINAALLTALVFNTKDPFVKPGDRVQLLAYIPGSSPANLGLLTPVLTDAAGEPILPKLPDRTASELGTRAFWQPVYSVPQGAPPEIKVTLQVKAGEKLLGSKTVTLYCVPAIDVAAESLSKDIAAREANVPLRMPNASFCAEKAGTVMKKIVAHDEFPSAAMGAQIIELLANAKRFLELETQGKDPWAGTTGYFERAYQSAVDDSAQPYQIQVPHSFDTAKNGDRKWPVVIFLHGYVPTYDRSHWWDEMPEFDQFFDRHDCFLALPFGRSNTDFQSCGETDVLDVIADVKKHYPIDADRVYLYGYSMGGMAIYSIAAHHPDLFAAGVVLAGRADSPLQNFKPLENFHPYKQWLIHADNPISLCENFSNLPLRLYHGRDDTIINVSEARRMEKRLLECGCDAKLTLGPGSHGYGLEIMMQEKPVEWLLTQKRNVNPEKRHIKSYRLQWAQQGNVAVTASTGALAPLELEWTDKDGAVAFTHDDPNVVQRSIAGKLKPEKLPPGASGLRKTPQLCGPVREATCGPFLLVYGTKGTPEAAEANHKNALQFAADWKEFTKSNARIKSDVELTPQDCTTYNLFLFGEEQENAMHAACAPKLPIQVKNGNVTIAGKQLPLAGKGIIYIYPSPLSVAEPHSIVICAGLLYGQGISYNHKLDLVPDFILFDDKPDSDGTNTNRFIAAGFFDGEWKVDPKMTWWADK